MTVQFVRFIKVFIGLCFGLAGPKANRCGKESRENDGDSSALIFVPANKGVAGFCNDMAARFNCAGLGNVTV